MFWKQFYIVHNILHITFKISTIQATHKKWSNLLLNKMSMLKYNANNNNKLQSGHYSWTFALEWTRKWDKLLLFQANI